MAWCRVVPEAIKTKARCCLGHVMHLNLPPFLRGSDEDGLFQGQARQRRGVVSRHVMHLNPLPFLWGSDGSGGVLSFALLENVAEVLHISLYIEHPHLRYVAIKGRQILHELFPRFNLIEVQPHHHSWLWDHPCRRSATTDITSSVNYRAIPEKR